MAESREWSYDGAHGPLVGRSWRGADEPTHVVVIAHGYGEHIGRYERVADALVRNGAVVYAVDHVGHGKSEGERVLVLDFEDVVTDLHALDETARHEHPDLPVVLLGHSMGGLIAARYAQRYGDTLAALVLSSPLVGRWDAAAQLLALDEIPDTPLDITTLSRDPRVGETYAADPLVWHGPFKRVTLEAIGRGLEAITTGPSLGDLPLMWIHGEDDQLVPIEGSRVGIAHLRGPHLVERTYPQARHELFNELNADDVIEDVTAFIRGRISANRSTTSTDAPGRRMEQTPWDATMLTDRGDETTHATSWASRTALRSDGTQSGRDRGYDVVHSRAGGRRGGLTENRRPHDPLIVSIKWARAAFAHCAFTGIRQASGSAVGRAAPGEGGSATSHNRTMCSRRAVLGFNSPTGRHSTWPLTVRM